MLVNEETLWLKNDKLLSEDANIKVRMTNCFHRLLSKLGDWRLNRNEMLFDILDREDLRVPRVPIL